MFASLLSLCFRPFSSYHFFRPERSIVCADQAQKKIPRNMITAETHATDKAAAVAAQGTHDAPEKAPSKAANGTKQGAKAKATAPKKAAKAGGKSSKKAGNRERKAASPRAESKGAKILEMIARAK